MRILITGCTGTLGTQLVRRFTERGDTVTGLSRDPHKQEALRRDFPNVRFVLADICDRDRVLEACEGQNYVVHAAALKHVNVGEKQVEEFIRVNITGTQNLVWACRAANVPIALFISSDKAVDPINLYGITKAAGENLFLAYGYSVLRYGNVIGSRGSVFEAWRKSMLDGERVTVRTPYPTRFFLKVSEAVNLVVSALDNAWRGDVFIPRALRAFSMLDVTKALLLDTPKEEPLLGGEKQHEVLLSKHEQGEVVNELLATVHKGYEGELDHQEFSSDTAPRMSVQELREYFINEWA